MWLAHLTSIVLTAACGFAIMAAIELGVTAIGLAGLWLGFWAFESKLMPGEVARTELPGGGSAWIRQGRGEDGLSTLFVAVPGKPTARWHLPVAGLLGSPTLTAGTTLQVRGADGWEATLDWRRDLFTAGGAARPGPDGLVDAWGRWTAGPDWQGLTLSKP